MKKLLLTLFIALGALATQAQQIKWMTIDEALAAQKKKAKPIFMDVYTDWCGPCKMLDKNTFHDAAVVSYINKNYYPVKFNAEGNSVVNYKKRKYTNPQYVEGRHGRNGIHQFTLFLQVEAYPTMVLFDKKGDVKSLIVGSKKPQELLDLLQAE